jgi:hypothetical protein
MEAFEDQMRLGGAEFLVTGEFPGDGKPKPVAFPDPSTCSTQIGGVYYLRLPTLLELKRPRCDT